MNLKPIHFLFTAGLFILIACRPDSQQKTDKGTLGADSSLGYLVADTITYDVVIRNPDPEDLWRAQCLQGLDRQAFIDNIFNMLYEEKAIAYHFETREKITPAQLKNLESDGFKRDNIGMIQFTETWYLDPQQNQMTKKVLFMVLGYDYYTSEGELFGHKPLFRVELSQ